MVQNLYVYIYIYDLDDIGVYNFKHCHQPIAAQAAIYRQSWPNG